MCRSSQLLNDGSEIKSKQADPGACFSTLCAQNSQPAPKPPPHSITFSFPFIRESFSRREGWYGGRSEPISSVTIFLSTLGFFFDQSRYWFCNCRDEVSFHLPTWPLPKSCFQFFKKDCITSIPFPFFLKCFKPCFSLFFFNPGFLYHHLPSPTSQGNLGCHSILWLVFLK